MATETRRLYRSANGDRCISPDLAVIRQTANVQTDFSPLDRFRSRRSWTSAPMPKGPKGQKHPAERDRQRCRVMEIATGQATRNTTRGRADFKLK